MGTKISRLQLIEDIKDVAAKLDRAPLTTEYDTFGKYSVSKVRIEFGSWRAALESCNIELTQQHRKLNSDSDILTELDRLTDLLGHQPSWSEIKAHGSISPDTFGRRLGRSNFTNPADLPLSPEWSVDTIPSELGAWIAGFTTGEGSFGVNKTGAIIFGLCQRADDRELLELTRTTMDLPYPVYIYSNANRRSQGQRAGDEARLHVNNRWVSKLRVIPFFDRFPLRGRKALDFAIFKEAVLFLCQRDEDGRFRRHFIPEEKSRITELANQITALRHDPSSTHTT